MKYTLLVALFAILALASSYPTGDEETPKVVAEAESEVKTETKVDEAAAGVAEKAAETTGDAAKEAVAEPAAAAEAVAAEPAAVAEAATAVSEDDKCEPGSSFQKECNTCVCPPSGARSLGMCTLKLCVGEGAPSQ